MFKYIILLTLSYSLHSQDIVDKIVNDKKLYASP